MSLDGTAVTTGLDISGNSRSSDVVVTGGTINNGVRINNSGTGTVMIGADITDNAGFAVQVANRAAGSGDVTVSGNVKQQFRQCVHHGQQRWPGELHRHCHWHG